MKKFGMTILMMSIAASGFCQKSMVKKAKNALLEPVDLVEAQKSIDQAISNDETSSDPLTYKVAGDVYKAVYDAEVKKRMLNQSYNEKLLNDGLMNSANYYVNCAELEQIPDEKGKISTKYDKDLKKSFSKLTDLLAQEGYSQLQKNNYETSLKLFEAYMSIPNCSIMKDEKVDTTYNLVEYLAINAALLNKDNKTAIKYMMELKDADYSKETTIYQWLVDALQAEKDTTKSLEILSEALKKHPSDQYMIGKQVNYYIEHGQKQQAIKYLDDAIAANPSSPEYYNVKANILISDKKYDEALALYQKAQSVDSKNVDAVQGIGVTYVVKANEQDAAADKQKSDAAYKKGRSEAEVTYKKALEYLEKAHSMYSTPNKDNLYWLKVVYARLSMSAKVKEINVEMSTIK